MKFFQAVKTFLYEFFVEDLKSQEYNYYCDASDLTDLEGRMKLVERGLAPFQKQSYTMGITYDHFHLGKI